MQPKIRSPCQFQQSIQRQRRCWRWCLFAVGMASSATQRQLSWLGRGRLVGQKELVAISKTSSSVKILWLSLAESSNSMYLPMTVGQWTGTLGLESWQQVSAVVSTVGETEASFSVAHWMVDLRLGILGRRLCPVPVKEEGVTVRKLLFLLPR